MVGMMVDAMAQLKVGMKVCKKVASLAFQLVDLLVQ